LLVDWDRLGLFNVLVDVLRDDGVVLYTLIR
jgi:hypothetical protein